MRGAHLFSAGSLARFWKRVRKDGRCWVWTGAVGGLGYPAVTLSGYRGGARITWVWQHGEAPGGLLRNDCGNLLCVNPAHWHDEGPRRVSLCVRRKGEIERLVREGLGIGDIADRVGCSRSTVSRRIAKMDFGPPMGETDADLRS